MGFPHYLKMAKVANPNSALFIDPVDKKYAILFVTRKDYQDENQKLAVFVKAFQNSAKVREILNKNEVLLNLFNSNDMEEVSNVEMD